MWRMELSCHSFDVAYRPSEENTAVDTLTRVCSSAVCKEEFNYIESCATQLLYALSI